MTPRQRWSHCCALGLAVAALPVRAQEPQSPGLNWVRLTGAGSCLSAAALAQQVEGRVGRVLFAPASEAGLFVDGHVAPVAVPPASEDGPAAAPGWLVVLELSSREGEVLGRRELRFEGGDCGVIDEAVALVIAVTLYPNTGLLGSGIPLDPSTAASLQALFGQEPTDPDPGSLPAPAAQAGSSTDDVGKAGPGESPAGASAGGASATDERAAAGSEATPRHEAGAEAVMGHGHVPGLRPGASAHLSIALPTLWPLEAGVLFFPETTQRTDGGGRAHFDLLMITLRACPLQPSWLPGLALCAGTEVGRLRVVSEGFAEGAIDRQDAVASVTGAARLTLPLVGPLSLRVSAVLAVPLDQRRYTAQTGDGGSATLFRIPQLAARAGLGLSLAF